MSMPRFYILSSYISLIETHTCVWPAVIDISILLSLMVALLSIMAKAASLDIPRPNLSVKVSLQSRFLGRFATPLACLFHTLALLSKTWQCVIPPIIGVGLFLAFRLPIRFMLDALGLLSLYPLANLMITLCFLIIVANLLGLKVKPIQIWLAVALAFLSMVLV